jgi:hypothetical protein
MHRVPVPYPVRAIFMDLDPDPDFVAQNDTFLEKIHKILFDYRII